MVNITVFDGTFDDGDEIGDFNFASVPQVGDKISIKSITRTEVTEVHHHVDNRGNVAVSISIAEGYRRLRS